MKTVRHVLIGFVITLVIVAVVNSASIKSELYTILKLRGCENGCTDDKIEYIVSLPRAEFGSDVVYYSQDKRLIYLITFNDTNDVKIETILNME